MLYRVYTKRLSDNDHTLYMTGTILRYRENNMRVIIHKLLFLLSFSPIERKLNDALRISRLIFLESIFPCKCNILRYTQIIKAKTCKIKVCLVNLCWISFFCQLNFNKLL